MGKKTEPPPPAEQRSGAAEPSAKPAPSAKSPLQPSATSSIFPSVDWLVQASLPPDLTDEHEDETAEPESADVMPSGQPYPATQVPGDTDDVYGPPGLPLSF